MKHLLDEARRTMCEDFGMCEGWAKLGPEAGAALGQDMSVLLHADDGSEEEQDVLSKWGDELEKTDGMFAGLPPEGIDQLRAAIEADSKDDAMAALAAHGLDYLDIPDDWEEECLPCQQGDDELPEQGDDESPEQYRDRTGRCPAGMHWDDSAGKCGETGDAPADEPSDEPSDEPADDDEPSDDPADEPEAKPSGAADSAEAIRKGMETVGMKSAAGTEFVDGPYAKKIYDTLSQWGDAAKNGEGAFEDLPKADREAVASAAESYKSALDAVAEYKAEKDYAGVERMTKWAEDSRKAALDIVQGNDLDSYEPSTPSENAPSKEEVTQKLSDTFDSGAMSYHTVDEPEHLEVMKQWADEADKGDDGMFAHLSKKQQAVLGSAVAEIAFFEDELADYNKKGGKKLRNRPAFVDRLQKLSGVAKMIAGASSGEFGADAAQDAMETYKKIGARMPYDIDPKLSKNQSKLSPRAQRLVADLLSDD